MVAELDSAMTQTFSYTGREELEQLLLMPGYNRHIAELCLAATVPGQTLLDFGAGTGTISALVRDRAQAAKIWCVEIDTANVAALKNQGFDVLTDVAQAPPSTVDVIYSSNVLEHIEDDVAKLEELRRCLKPGGQIIIYAPNRLYPFETHGFYFLGRYYFRLLPFVNWLPDPVRDLFCPHVRIYTQRRIRGLFDDLDVDFDVQSHIFPGLDNVASRHQFFGRWLHATVDLIESTPLRCFGISHFVVARKMR